MWIDTFFLTLSFFLIALGFGLFILMLASVRLIRESGLTRLQLIVLAFSIGSTGTGVCLQCLSLISSAPYVNLGVVALVSLLGILTTHQVWRPRREDRTEIVIWLAISLPMALATWWWTFGAFSHYPFGDIGADVHWIRTAQEFANIGILNPNASQSYIDIRSALAGALSETLGLDLLQFNWLYRYFSILYFSIVFYAVADSIFLDSRRKWFALFFAAASNVLGLVTNGSLAVAGSFVLLSVLLDSNSDRKQHLAPSTSVTAGAALAGLPLAFFINNNTLMLASLPALSLLCNVSSRMGGHSRNLTINAFRGVVWSLTLMLVHRESYLLVPIVVAGWVFYVFVVRSLSNAALLSIKLLWTLALLLPLICAGILACLSLAHFGYLPSVNANEFFSRLTLPILGREIKSGEEINLGVGPQIAAIEIGRAIGPFFAISLGVIFVWYWKTFRTTRLTKPVSGSSALATGDDATGRLLWSWTMGCGLSLTVLSGFPFLYRIAFLILGFFTIAATEIFFQVFVDGESTARRRRMAAAVSIAAISALVFGLYAVSWQSNPPYLGYQRIFGPSEIAGIVAIVPFALLIFTGSRRAQIIGLAVVVSLSVTVDRSGESTLFRVYSYGPLPDGIPVVSHYDANDLKANYWLRASMHRAVLVSDPYTLGMATAIAGLPPLFLFSNLDTVNRATATHAKELIGSIVNPEGNENAGLKTCFSLSPFLETLNQEAYFQIHQANFAEGIFRSVRIEQEQDEGNLSRTAGPHSVDDVKRRMKILSTPEGNWNVVAIINPRTLQWIRSSNEQRIPYFPSQVPLKPELLRKLQDGPFDTVYSDGYTAIVVIDCATAIDRSP